MTKKKQALDIYIVAGGQSAGKSSVIKNLTNRKKGGFVKITGITGKQTDFYFRSQSLQEKKIAPDAFKQIIDKALRKRQFSAVLIALRTNYIEGPNINLPYNKLTEEYIDYFMQIGWNIKFVAELPGTAISLHVRKNKYKHDFFGKPTISQLTSQVKKFFNFL